MGDYAGSEMYIELTENLHRHADIYENVSFPVIFLSPGLEILWTNRIFRDYYLPEDFYPLEIESAFDTVSRILLNSSNGHSAKIRVGMLSRNTTKITANMLLMPFSTEHGNAEQTNLLGILDDITDENKSLLRKTYLGLLEASKLKDNDTGNHIKRVGAYAKRIAEELHRKPGYDMINQDYIENIHFLAPMHDVGKIGTPDHILNKKGSLTDDEWVIMKEHTINGAMIMANYPDEMAREIARSHHEWWDGTGYMFGLAENLIPLSARITAIADCYDAIRMKRSYKDAIPHEKTVDILKSEAGTHFDPGLIDVFLDISDPINDIYQALADDLPQVDDEDLESLEILEDL